MVTGGFAESIAASFFDLAGVVLPSPVSGSDFPDGASSLLYVISALFVFCNHSQDCYITPRKKV